MLVAEIVVVPMVSMGTAEIVLIDINTVNTRAAGAEKRGPNMDRLDIQLVALLT